MFWPIVTHCIAFVAGAVSVIVMFAAIMRPWGPHKG
jgi:hypothetical protein